MSLTNARVFFHAMDLPPWQEAQSRLAVALTLRRRAHLLSPTTRLLHDLLDAAVRKMHLQALREMLETEAGLLLDGDDAQIEPLYKSELSEHGLQNMVRVCQAGNWAVSVGFPECAEADDDALLEIEMPFVIAPEPGRTGRLLEALGFRLTSRQGDPGLLLRLGIGAGRNEGAAALELLDLDPRQDCLGEIFAQLGYGMIHFSPIGEAFAVTPSMLARLGLDPASTSVAALTEAIPLSFHNDIVWGYALGDGNGAFENYRIRVPLRGHDDASTLFNVSGFRKPDGSIYSLWQSVFQEQGGAKYSEGSMLSEVRIRNITRNYVPQLVEQKAREAVRLGKTSLENEERQVAILFCDIVGFTSYAETYAESESVIDTLNTILRRVSVSVKRNRGSIDKFMGDCIMALFDDPADAVLAATDMQEHAMDINTLRLRAGQSCLRLRVGIHWGKVVIGNVGTAERLDWTAIGDVVNTASRIEKGCNPGAILVSCELRDEIIARHPGEFMFDVAFRLKVKGKRKELAVCHVGTFEKHRA